MSMSVDGWLTPSGEKWLGFCRILRSLTTGKVIIDVSRFVNITKSGESEETLKLEIRNELGRVMSRLGSDERQNLVSLITDSAACNVLAKK